MKMKKIPLLVILTIVAGSLFAQQTNKPAADHLSEDLLALQTANMLARYGYANDSASALIGAAEIFVQIQTQAMNEKPQRNQQASASDGTAPDYSPAKLLADAKKLAGKDKTMTAWANEVQKYLNTKTRGVVGGPKWAMDTIRGGDTHTYTFNLRANETTEFLLVGGGSSELDLYLYDGNGTYLIGDEGYGDDGYIWIIPVRTGPFQVVVKNWGKSPNHYQLYTN
jgi:hypothetical protein